MCHFFPSPCGSMIAAWHVLPVSVSRSLVLLLPASYVKPPHPDPPCRSSVITPSFALKHLRYLSCNLTFLLLPLPGEIHWDITCAEPYEGLPAAKPLETKEKYLVSSQPNMREFYQHVIVPQQDPPPHKPWSLSTAGLPLLHDYR